MAKGWIGLYDVSNQRGWWLLDALVATSAVLQEITHLPPDWHGAGCLTEHVLRAIERHSSGRSIRHSAETGTGKSTLLLAHLSADHTVFAQNDRGDGDSLMRVQESHLLRRERVTFVVGPTQQTLPRHVFREPLDLVLLDGPHGFPFVELEYYFIYPHLKPGALIIVDDIDIPSVFGLFDFLRDDEMFELIDVVHQTAFFQRTVAPTFNALGDGWWLQRYNRKRHPIRDSAIVLSWKDRVKRRIPAPLKRVLRRMRG